MPRGRGWFGRGFGWGYGWPGNPYPFCRRFPWLPRWWWAYPMYGLPYYGIPWGQPYFGYGYGAYASSYRYPFYMPY